MEHHSSKTNVDPASRLDLEASDCNSVTKYLRSSVGMGVFSRERRHCWAA